MVVRSNTIDRLGITQVSGLAIPLQSLLIVFLHTVAAIIADSNLAHRLCVLFLSPFSPNTKGRLKVRLVVGYFSFLHLRFALRRALLGIGQETVLVKGNATVVVLLHAHPVQQGVEQVIQQFGGFRIALVQIVHDGITALVEVASALQKQSHTGVDKHVGFGTVGPLGGHFIEQSLGLHLLSFFPISQTRPERLPVGVHHTPLVRLNALFRLKSSQKQVVIILHLFVLRSLARRAEFSDMAGGLGMVGLYRHDGIVQGQLGNDRQGTARGFNGLLALYGVLNLHRRP